MISVLIVSNEFMLMTIDDSKHIYSGLLLMRLSRRSLHPFFLKFVCALPQALGLVSKCLFNGYILCVSQVEHMVKKTISKCDCQQ